ncbi:hypothetical protein GBAR_LOCUS29055 [Geodia barretti]|uniref:Uncharacterized protein n=1 Tax=Geodia barretti TaxID=519541 RepID=A0AA35TRL3_GEOBA|nr:hypothetical protein GBAR_LOCUS29055 [Geodia barretti]
MSFVWDWFSGVLNYLGMHVLTTWPWVLWRLHSKRLPDIPEVYIHT